MKFTVQRSKWVRGDGGTASAMLVGPGKWEGRMCCLGFLGKACGYTDDELRERGTPLTVFEKTAKNLFPAAILTPDDFHGHRTGYREILHANDSSFITEDEREGRLKQLFAERGIEITFED